MRQIPVLEPLVQGARQAHRSLPPSCIIEHMQEPSVSVEVVTPPEFLGDLVADFSRRGGRPERQEQREELYALIARVPLNAMGHYTTDLHSLTQGRAFYTVRFDA